MSHAYTLHQLVNAPSQWTSIAQINATWQANDALVLLGEAAQGYADVRLKAFAQLYMLQADANLLGLNGSTPNCHLLTYDEWAKLILSYTRHIRWK